MKKTIILSALLFGSIIGAFAQEEVSDYQPSRHSFAYNDYKIQRGYRGHIDIGFSKNGSSNEKIVEFTNSHGYQFSPYFFLGGGTGFGYWIEDEIVSLPVFVNLRTDFPTGSNISPYIDVKFGFCYGIEETNGEDYYYNNNGYTRQYYYDNDYDWESFGGIYSNLSVGCRFATSRLTAINVSVGHQFQRLLSSDIYFDDYNGHRWRKKKIFNGIAIKLGFEF